jgi:hypothetical protein
MKAGDFKYDCGLDLVFAIFDKICFSNPSFQCCTVCHQESAVAFVQSAYKNVNPQSYDCGQMLEKVVGCSKLQVVKEIVSPSIPFITVASKTSRT